MAGCFAEAIQFVENSNLIAIASSSSKKLNHFSNKHQIDRKYCFERYIDLLRCDEIDVVYISLPNNLHFEWISKSIESSKHILVEKPVTVNSEELEKILGKVKLNSLLFREGFMYLHHPQTQKCLKKITDGLIGLPTEMNSSFGYNILPKPSILQRLKDRIRNKTEPRQFNKKLGGGCILDLGCYLTSFSHLISRIRSDQHDPIPTFSNTKFFFGSKKVEVDSSTELKFNNNFSSHIHASFVKELGQKTIIRGSEGEIVINSSWSCAESGYVLNGKYEKIESLEYENPYSYQIHSISDCILKKEVVPDYPIFTHKEMLTNMKILDKWSEQKFLKSKI
jgi:predicted dehydrogenase